MNTRFSANLAYIPSTPDDVYDAMGVDFIQDPNPHSPGGPHSGARPVVWIQKFTPTMIGRRIDPVTGEALALGHWDLDEADQIIRGAGYRRIQDWTPVSGGHLQALITPA